MTLLSNFQNEFTYMFNNFKEPVTITNITRTKDSHDDYSESESNTVTYAMIEHITDEIEHERYADIQNADAIAIFTPDEVINLKDEVVIDSVEYEIADITSVGVAGTAIYKEVILKKKD